VKRKVLRRQRPHRTHVDGVERVRVVELGAGRGGDLFVIAALLHLELVDAGDLVTHADAARAEDAALGVEHDVRAEVDDLGLLDLGRVDARVGVVVLEVVLLQRALAGLVTDRAVDRVIDQGELEHLLAGQRRLLVGGVHHHALADRLLAARLQLRVLLDRDQTLPAARRDRQAGVVAERADVDADRLGGLEDVRALGHRHGLAVDGERHRRGRGRRGGNRRRGGRRGLGRCVGAHLSHSPPIMLIMPKIGTMSAMRWFLKIFSAVDRCTNDGLRT
jgi:hypothetical protein